MLLEGKGAIGEGFEGGGQTDAFVDGFELVGEFGGLGVHFEVEEGGLDGP